MRTLAKIGAVMLLAMGIAGCGVTSTATTNGAGAQPTSTPKILNASLNGCTTQTGPVNAAPPDVIVSNAQQSPTQPVSIAVNKTLEVRLSAAFTWQLDASAPLTSLTLLQPAGWYDATNTACDWLFTAATPGQVTLQFSGGLVCASGVACPALAALATVKVNVTA